MKTTEKISTSATRDTLRLSKWSLTPAARGINFVGYRTWHDYKLIRRSSVVRARRRLKWLAEHGKDRDGEMFVAAWRGHTAWANAHRLGVALNIKDESVCWPPYKQLDDQALLDQRWWIG